MKFYQKIGFRLYLIVTAALAAIAMNEVIADKRLAEVIDSSAKDALSAQVKTTLSYLEHYEKEVQAGHLTLEEAQTRARDVLNSLSTSEFGYFYAFTSDLTVVAHGGSPELIGSNQAGKQDLHGAYVYEGLLGASQNGGDTFRYYYSKPGETTPVPKVSYVERFAPWDWNVGTGLYFDGVEAQIAADRKSAALVDLMIATALLVLSFFLGRTITGPLKNLQMRMQAMTEGDADAEVPGIARHDEVGAMARAIDIFREKLIENRQLESDAREAAKAAAASKEREAEAKAAAEREELARQKKLDEETRQRKAEEEARAQQARKQETERLEKERDAQQLVVGEIGRGLKSLAAGDLSLRLSQPFGEGYDQLRADFNSAIESLADLIGELMIESDTLGTASSKATISAGSATDRSRQNAASLEETSAALHEVSASVTSAAESAREVSQMVKQTNDTASSSRDVVTEAVGAMHRIADSSREIASIISVMENIAFQTNLLALNAGVEAARAGEQGRGFAVVASEVRALAQRSSEAATEVRTLIEQSGQHVDAGVELVDSTGDSLQKIADAVAQISNGIISITASTEEQSRALTVVSSTVSDIDRASQKATTSLSEVDSSCKTMQTSCNKLQRHVAHFKLAKHGTDLAATG